MAEELANGDMSKVDKIYGELKEQMSKGAISAEMVTKAFQHATSKGGRFYNMMQKQSQTLSGQFSTIIGNLKLFAVEIGNALMPVIKKLANITMRFVNFLQEHKGLAKAIGIGIMGLVGVLAIWLPLQWAINAALTANPIGLIIVGIAALIAGITFLIVKIEKVYNWWRKVRWIMLLISPVITIIIEAILQLFKAIKYLTKYGFEGLKLWLQELINGAVDIINKIITAINNALGTSIKTLNKVKWVDKKQLEEEKKQQEETETQSTGGILSPENLTDNNGIITPLGNNNENISAITGGGTRPTNINVTIDKLIENLIITAENFEEGLDEAVERVKEAFVRLLNASAEISQ